MDGNALTMVASPGEDQELTKRTTILNSGVRIVEISGGQRWISYHLDVTLVGGGGEKVRCSINDRDAARMLMTIAMSEA